MPYVTCNRGDYAFFHYTLLGWRAFVLDCSATVRNGFQASLKAEMGEWRQGSLPKQSGKIPIGSVNDGDASFRRWGAFLSSVFLYDHRMVPLAFQYPN